jgi:hypothetical protein
MKKTYMTPQTEEVKIEVARMIAGSEPDVKFKSGETEDFGSRGGNTWFDDDDEY